MNFANFLLCGVLMGGFDLESLPPDQVQDLQQAVEVIEKSVPSLFCGLNVAQKRALINTYTKDSKTDLLPSISIVSFANGCGKTHVLILDMIGVTMGPDFIDQTIFPPEAITYYNSLKKLRDQGKLSLRLVCDAEDMKEGGSVFVIMKEMFPWAKPAGMDNSKCYRQVVVNHPEIPGVHNAIAVRTFDQKEVKHSGSTCQKIWINEPIPSELVGETVGRIRSKSGNPDGTILMTATLLDQASWVNDLEDDDRLRVAHSRGHLYENCVGEDVTPEMAAEVKRTIGIEMQKNPDGPGYLTGGVLKKAQIDAQIALWERACPDQVEARKSGASMTGGGTIHPMYWRQAHSVRDETYDRSLSYPAVQICDPHGARPDFSAWGLITPSGRLVVIKEWPEVSEFGPFDRIDRRPYTIEQECEIWQRIEAELQLTNRIVERIGDPNRFREPNPRNNLTLQWEFSQYGFDFNINVNDNLEFGIEKVNQYLYFDRVRYEINENDPAAIPRLLIADRCENIHRAVARFRRKANVKRDAPLSEKLDEKFKDPCDILRYLVVWHATTGQDGIAGYASSVCPDYERAKTGRIPKRFRPSIDGFARRMAGALR